MDRLPRDLLVLIFDVVQRITRRAYDLCLVSKRWAAIIIKLRNRYSPLLHHAVVLVAEDFFRRLRSGHVTNSASLGFVPGEREPIGFSCSLRHRDTHFHLLHQALPREQYQVITSPLVDIVLIPIPVRRNDYVQLLSAHSRIRDLWPMPMRVRVIVVVTDIETLVKDVAEQEFLTFCAYFDSVVKLAPHVLAMRTFIPITTTPGSNDGIYNRAEGMDWYHGPTLLDALSELRFCAPALPISDAPLLLVCTPPTRLETGNVEVMARVFRRKLCVGRILYLLQEPLEVLELSTHSGSACEGAVVAVTLAGAAAPTCTVGDVLDGDMVSNEVHKLDVFCTVSLRELPRVCPLLTAGFEFMFRMHIAVAVGVVTKLIAVITKDGTKKAPHFVKSKARVVCRLRLEQQVWMVADNEDSSSGFNSFTMEYYGEVIGHGRVLRDTNPHNPTPAEQLSQQSQSQPQPQQAPAPEAVP